MHIFIMNLYNFYTPLKSQEVKNKIVLCAYNRMKKKKQNDGKNDRCCSEYKFAYN